MVWETEASCASHYELRSSSLLGQDSQALSLAFLLCEMGLLILKNSKEWLAWFREDRNCHSDLCKQIEGHLYKDFGSHDEAI